MHIIKQDNGLYRVEIKKIKLVFYVENYNDALKIAFNIGGVENAE